MWLFLIEKLVLMTRIGCLIWWTSWYLNLDLNLEAVLAKLIAFPTRNYWRIPWSFFFWKTIYKEFFKKSNQNSGQKISQPCLVYKITITSQFVGESSWKGSTMYALPRLANIWIMTIVKKNVFWISIFIVEILFCWTWNSYKDMCYECH